VLSNNKKQHFLFFYQQESVSIAGSHTTAQASGRNVLEKSYTHPKIVASGAILQLSKIFQT